MKRSKALWKVSVTTTPEAEDAVAEMLGDILKLPASSYFDLEKKISRVTVFVTSKISPSTLPKIREGLNIIKTCGIDIGAGKVSALKVRCEDWAESWKRHFKPIEIGDTLLVKPDWSKKRPRAGQAVVILNPGLSFGTGQHPTTLFCLKEMARNANQSLRKKVSAKLRENCPSFLDIGTGSGILAIAAAKLGYQPVCAMDFDPQAVRIARANALANDVKIRLFRGDVAKLPTRPRKRFNFICANLISGLLVKERKRITAQLKPGGVLAVAGILKSEFASVRCAFKELGLKLITTKSEKEWRSGSFFLSKKF
jgi:ribosomal protein L11 methyltransferase